MPEANGTDILADMRDFFNWLQSPSFSSSLPEGISVDLDHLLITGESAGGWLALQSGLHIPQLTSAVIMDYPMLDLRDKHYTQAYPKELFSPPAPQIPPHVLQDFVESLDGNEVVSARMPPSGVPLVLSMLQQGLTERFLGNDRSLYPLELLGDLVSSGTGILFPMWIIHGTKDTVVPVEGTQKFADDIKQRIEGVKVLVTLREGEDHGFDNHDAETGRPAALETEWVQEGLDFMKGYWRV